MRLVDKIEMLKAATVIGNTFLHSDTFKLALKPMDGKLVYQIQDVDLRTRRVTKLYPATIITFKMPKRIRRKVKKYVPNIHSVFRFTWEYLD